MDDTIKALADEISTALADLVHCLEEGQANVGDIGATLAEMLELARAAKEPQAVPQVNVTVQPAAVTVQPAPSRSFRITHTYDSDGRISESLVKPIEQGT